MNSICKNVSLNDNKYTVIMTCGGSLFFSVYISTTGANRQLYTPKIQAAIMTALVEADHAEALAMDAEMKPTAQAEARTQTVARRNSLTHKIGIAFAGLALAFSGFTHAEVAPSYPVDASRLSLEGYVAVSIDCDAKKVDVVRESTSAAYFSRQVKKQVLNICYGQTGTLDRVYTFVMNKTVGAHDMLVNNSNRHPL
ncbi:MAG: hypothetical protein [Bacteriophage sp.]|nr:MAG: hypothetical protein [Bacteriophage sp.]